MTTADFGPVQVKIYEGDALDAYPDWDQPNLIMSDGAYGVGGFHGDPRTPNGLDTWYRPHVEQWSKFSKFDTTLWFWNTEIGWANVHPVMVENGWEYVQAIHWDKGIAHIAGNVNGRTIRRFPIANEICVFYQRALTFEDATGRSVHAREWLREEWRRTGLPFRKANEACGVKDAATRKYFDQGWLWYPPPTEVMERLVTYANRHGAPAGRPYYSIDRVAPVSSEVWSQVRYRWHHEHGLTNVWSHPPLHSGERLRGNGTRQAPRVYKPKAGVASAHLNQKPLLFMERIIQAATDPCDVIWEPFGGLCSATVAAAKLGRNAYAAEIDPAFVDLARARLAAADEDQERRLF